MKCFQRVCLVESEKMLNSNLTAILSGGIETTATQLVWVIQLLAQHPEIQEEAHAQINDVIGQDDVNYDNVQQCTFGEKS